MALYRLVPFGICVGLLSLLHASGAGVAGLGRESTTVAIGFLLVSAFLAGQWSSRLGLPRITGYLLSGVVIGPHVLELLTHDMIAAGKAVEGIAVALIALTAGGELRMEWLKRQIRRLLLITTAELLVVAVGVLLLVFFGRSLFPFMPDDDLMKAGVIAMIFGAVAVANSPTVAIAVIAENKADGPLTRTVLGVTIIKDVFVIVLFAIAMTVARDLLGEGGGDSLGWTLGRELGGSVLAGVGFGVGISLFLRYVNRDVPVFILAACFAISQVADAFHLEALLTALVAGFYVENYSRAGGEELIAGIERVSLPVYALFFAAAGAKVDLGALASMWPLALLLSAVRAVCVYGGTRLGATLAGAEPVVVRYAWLGFISQAGVTLALSAIVMRTFPSWGTSLQVLIVAMIALHELVGPIVFQYSLRRSGEAGATARAGGADPAGPR
jgi:Kef-type K+ transport system membrane component KefB